MLLTTIDFGGLVALESAFRNQPGSHIVHYVRGEQLPPESFHKRYRLQKRSSQQSHSSERLVALW
jgi:hypothetical protein